MAPCLCWAWLRFYFFSTSASALGYHSGIILGENSWIETATTNAKQKLDSGLDDALSFQAVKHRL